jgi:phosphoglycolate phosphatase
MVSMPGGKKIQAVLFDLDGTLIDTAPDLASALNHVLAREGKQPLAFADIRPLVSYGANGLLELGFGAAIEASKQALLKAELIAYYKQNIAVKSALFNGLEPVLEKLEACNIPWGIVTNKPQHLTEPLLDALHLTTRASCVVSGDQVSNSKPHPESFYLACRQLAIAPSNCVTFGDAERDIRAGKLAGCKAVACEYGYIPASSNINSWQADAIVKSPAKLAEYLQTQL